MLWRNTMISKQHPVMKTPKLFWKKWWWKWHKSQTFTNLFLFIFCQRKRREHVYVCLCKRMKCNYHSEKRKKPKKEMQLVFKNNKCRKFKRSLKRIENSSTAAYLFKICSGWGIFSILVMHLAVYNYLSCPIEIWVIKRSILRSILRPKLNWADVAYLHDLATQTFI